jgi:hypothetical protein
VNFVGLLPLLSYHLAVLTPIGTIYNPINSDSRHNERKDDKFAIKDACHSNNGKDGISQRTLDVRIENNIVALPNESFVSFRTDGIKCRRGRNCNLPESLPKASPQALLVRTLSLKTVNMS